MNFRGPGITKIGDSLHLAATQSGFIARLTSGFSTSTGYSWERRVLVASTGVAAESKPLTGAHARTVDNDETLESGTDVWLEPDGNAQGYIIVAGGAGGGGGDGIGADCEGHGWLSDADALEDGAVSNDPKRTLSVVIHAGVGRCACIVRQPGILEVPNFYTAIFSTDTGLWHVLDLIDTCCSCAWMDISIPVRRGDAAETPPPATVTLDLVQSCDDEVNETYYLSRQCENELCFEVAMHGPMVCTSAPAPIPCDNTARAEICCADCTLANVECGVCCGCEAPPYWTILGAGFSGALSYLNRFIALPFTTDCTWGISCGGLTIGFGIAIDGADVTFTLTIGGAVYELTITNVNTVDCTINRTLSRISGDSGTTPATITIKPFSCEPLNNACFGGETPSAFLVTFHDCTSDFACLNGLEYTLTPDASDACGPGTTGYSGVVADSCMDPGNPGYLALCCIAGCQYQFIFDIPPCDVFGNCVLLDTTSCDPLTQEWRFTNLCALGQAFFTVTAIP